MVLNWAGLHCAKMVWAWNEKCLALFSLKIRKISQITGRKGIKESLSILFRLPFRIVIILAYTFFHISCCV